MTRLGAGAVALTIALAASACDPPPSGVSGTFNDPILQDALDHRVIVHLHPDSAARPQEVLDRYGLRADYIYETKAYAGFAVVVDDKSLNDLRADPDTASFNPDMPFTPLAVLESSSETPSPVVPTGMFRSEVELSPLADYAGGGGVDVDVAIVDSGLGHPDTRTHVDLNIHPGQNFIKPNPNSDPDPDDWGDSDGHGTHVAGTVGAINNAFGVVGVAPGARVYGFKVFSDSNNPFSGNGSFAVIEAALAEVLNRREMNGDPVFESVNMSLSGNIGGSTYVYSNEPCTVVATGDSFRDAICALIRDDISVVVAAGNANQDIGDEVIPAAYDEVITVGAYADFDGEPGGLVGSVTLAGFAGNDPIFTDTGDLTGEPYCRPDVDDSLADFSNFGDGVDIMAPGVCIYSTWRGKKMTNGGADLWYATISGTSMASPHVAGAAALYKGAHPDATAAQVRDALVSWAKPSPYIDCFADGNDPAPCGAFPMMHMSVLDADFDTESAGVTNAFNPHPSSQSSFSNVPGSIQFQTQAGSTRPLIAHPSGDMALSIGYTDTGTANEVAGVDLCLPEIAPMVPDTASSHIQASFSIFLDNFVDFNAIGIVSLEPDVSLVYHYLLDAAGRWRENSIVSTMGGAGAWHEVIIDIDRTSGTSSLIVDGSDATSLLGDGWPNTTGTEDMNCLRIVTWVDTTQQMWIDNVTVLSWDED